MLQQTDKTKKILDKKKSKLDRLIVKKEFNLKHKKILKLSKEIDKLIIAIIRAELKFIVS